MVTHTGGDGKVGAIARVSKILLCIGEECIELPDSDTGITKVKAVFDALRRAAAHFKMAMAGDSFNIRDPHSIVSIYGPRNGGLEVQIKTSTVVMKYEDIIALIEKLRDFLGVAIMPPPNKETK